MRKWILAVLIAAAALGCSKSDPVPQAVPTPAVAAETEKARGIHDRARERVLLAVVRSRAIRQMEQDGFALVGRSGTPIMRGRAEALYAQLTDDVVIGAVKEASPAAYGALGDGTLLGNLVKWIVEHQDEILAILKLVLTILALL